MCTSKPQMIINKLMTSYIKRPYLPIEMNYELLALINEGFVEWQGCFALKRFAPSLNESIKKVIGDDIGIECFVNHIHMSDYVSINFFPNALHLVKGIFNKWKQIFNDKVLIAYITINLPGLAPGTGDQNSLKKLVDDDPSDVVVRFHVRRGQTSYYDDKALDEFCETAILKLESGDDFDVG